MQPTALLLAATLWACSCNNGSVNETPQIDTSARALYPIAVALRDTILKSGVKIVTYKRSNNWHSRDSVQCADWHAPTVEQLAAIIPKMLPVVDGETDYEAHADFSCIVAGDLEVNHSIHHYELNAGGYLVIDSLRFCAGNDPSLARYFLSMEMGSAAVNQ